MQYNQNSKYANIVLIILLTIGFLFIAVNMTPPVRLIKNFIYYTVYPNILVANRIFQSAGYFSDNIKSIVYVSQQNAFYKQKNQELLDRLHNYEAVVSQYEQLCSLLNIPKIKNTKSVFARISVREPGEWFRWFIIDKGAQDGLYNELPVVAQDADGNLNAVGRIVETYKTSAKVALITNLLSAVPVRVKEKQINCLAEGFNTGEIKVTYIPLQSDIQEGDILTASPLSSVFYDGIPVAQVTEIFDDKSLDFKTATAKVLFKSDYLYEVVVLVPEEGKQ